MFNVRDLVLYFFILKLRVLFDSPQGCINKSLEVTKTTLEKCLKLNLG